MSSTVDLLWIGNGNAPTWPLGRTWFASEATPASVHEVVQDCLHSSNASAVLFWDCALGSPDPHAVSEIMSLPGDVWHAGLRLGTGGLPGLLDFVSPTWMLNRDPDPSIEATSWRLSLRACLVRTEVLRQMGDLNPGFQTLDGAALEMGHRYVSRGVLTRHIPWLCDSDISAED